MLHTGRMSRVAGGATVPLASANRVARLAPKCAQGRQRRLQLRAFTGFRQSNAVDAIGQSPTASLQAAVLRSSSRGRGTRQVTRAMFERFTEKAIKVVMLAQEEARRLGEPHPCSCIAVFG